MPVYLREARQMITEDQVVDAVCCDLEAHGWIIVRRATTRQRGADIVARRNGSELIVEAKGGTSARTTSNRFGEPFDAGQVHSHVGRALVEAMVAISSGALGAIALPADRLHTKLVGRMASALERARVHVLWVDEDGVSVVGVEGIAHDAVE